jgi:hypothetical protein
MGRFELSLRGDLSLVEVMMRVELRLQEKL